MNKKKKIFKILIFSLLITCIGSASVIALSNKSVKDKVDKLTAEFNSKKSKLEKTGNYDINSQEAKDIKALGTQISNLNETIKTEEDYSEELDRFIYNIKLGLADTKAENEIYFDQSRQNFIDKMEKKLARIESEHKANKEKKNKAKKSSNSITANSTENEIFAKSPSKQLIEQLKDTSDVE